MRARLALTLLLISFVLPAAASASPQAGLPRAPSTLDRSTPRRTLRNFLAAERRGDHLGAAYALDLRDVPARAQRHTGPRMASELKTVIDQGLALDLAQVSDDPAGDTGDGVASDTVGEITLFPGHRVPITLDRVDAPGGPVWVVSRSTLAELPSLYDRYGPAFLERYVPGWFPSYRFAGVWLWQWIGIAAVTALAAILGVVIASVALWIGRRVAARTKAEWDDRLVEIGRGPTRVLFFVVLAWAMLEPLGLVAPARFGAHRVLVTLLILDIAWLAQRAVRVTGQLVEERVTFVAREGGSDSARIRRIHTQVTMLRRVASVVIAFLAASLVLLQFEVVRTVGMSLLASAGIVGIVVGVAAQRSLAALFAGIQLSITQPIRMGDRVVVDNEIGTIEEINLTYVVMKLWDERRMVVPVTRFLETPFQNWTKVTNEILGTVFVHADYTLPVDEARRAFDAILESLPAWDRRSKSLYVTDANGRTVELRALVSARNADDLFALRCAVRERLVAFLRDLEGGRYLPRVRVNEADSGADARGAEGVASP